MICWLMNSMVSRDQVGMGPRGQVGMDHKAEGAYVRAWQVVVYLGNLPGFLLGILLGFLLRPLLGFLLGNLLGTLLGFLPLGFLLGILPSWFP